MKTPEEMAEEYCEEHDECEFARDAFLAGFKAGREITDQEIVDILVEIREREAKERSKRPAVQEDRHNKIWERIKVKVIGVLP